MITNSIEADTNGKPSNHKGILIVPRDNKNEVRTRDYFYKTVRPMPQSKILSFVEELKAIDLDKIKEEPDPQKLDIKLLEVMTEALNKCIPEKNNQTKKH